ncbi:MAG: hypothetical protein Q9169_004123 [Polycauliona sp. 2 TL-2023]
MASPNELPPIVCVVGFHHARGPELESWFGVEDGTDPAADNDWSFLPFMALSDGAHVSVEDFSYFTLRRQESPNRAASSAFGISCTRQMDASDLLHRPADVTRSTVQKAVVVIADNPRLFGHLREKLSMVTGAWFAQRDFADVDILKKFQESLTRNPHDTEDTHDLYLGLSLRGLIHEYKHQTLVLLKCILLQPKMLFFGSRCERLCMTQFSLISLIPLLLSHLDDCASPDLDAQPFDAQPPSSLKTSDRSSLLAYMGLPLRIFGKGSLFGPYTPLQQLDVLADHDRTKSYMVGSTNSLLLQQKDRYSDILVNLDDSSITISSPSLRNALALSAADRRWIDFLTQTVTSTWDPKNPSRPSTLAYLGSEEFIRLQFEEYILALLASVKHHLFTSTRSNTVGTQHQNHIHHAHNPPQPLQDFNPDWFSYWQNTPSYALFLRTTDAHLFDIVEPRHPTAGALTVEDVQRRITQQIATLQLDSKVAATREHLGRHLVTGQKKVSTTFEKLWGDIEAIRESQRKKAEAARDQDNAQGTFERKKSTESSIEPTTETTAKPPALSRFSTPSTPDLTAAQASVAAAGQKAGAYVSSWGSWAAEKRKGWGGVGVGWGRGHSGGATEAGVAEGHRSPGKKKSREVTGGDGIGRLDA